MYCIQPSAVVHMIVPLKSMRGRQPPGNCVRVYVEDNLTFLPEGVNHSARLCRPVGQRCPGPRAHEQIEYINIGF